MVFKTLTTETKRVIDANGDTFLMKFEKEGTDYYSMFSEHRTGPVLEPIRQFMDSVGDGSGTTNCIADFSGGGAAEYLIAPDSGTIIRLHHLLVNIADVGAVPDPAGYGNGSALTNGINITMNSGTSLIKDVLGGLAVKSISDWASVGEVVTHAWTTGSLVQVKIPFREIIGHPLRLDGTIGEELRVSFADDLSGLTKHTFLISGHVE